MIDDPPRLRLRRTFTRPDPALIARITGTPTGFIVDTRNGRGGLDWRIKPLADPTKHDPRFIGPALPVRCAPDDNLALMAAVEVAEPGDVVIATADGFTRTAIAGDNLIGMLRNKGVAALVIDGMVRDLADSLRMGLTVFCHGVTPNSAHRFGPGSIGLPIVIGGERVAAGDLLIGDADGVVTVPADEIAALPAKLERVRAAEAALAAQVADGLTVPDFIRKALDDAEIVEK